VTLLYPEASVDAVLLGCTMLQWVGVFKEEQLMPWTPKVDCRLKKVGIDSANHFCTLKTKEKQLQPEETGEES